MRADMKKVLCEKERAHSTWKYHDVRAANNRGDLDDLPTCQGIRRPYGYDTKEFNDLITPLRRYLRKAVGRPWNDVWSEICQHVPANSVTGQHLRGHVRQDVAQDVFIIDGEVMTLQRYRHGFVVPKGLYVDPRSGVLMMTEAKPRKPAPIVYHGRSYHRKNGVLYPAGWFDIGRYPVKPIDKHSEAVLLNGIWYATEIKEVPPPVRQVDLNGVTRWVATPQYDAVGCFLVHRGWYHVSKMQLSSTQLRRLGLQNQ